MRIVISGTPGTGKTKISKIISKKIGFKHIELNKIIRKEKLYSSYDMGRNCYVADMKKVSRYANKLRGNIIIDSHLSHLLNADIVIILRCRPDLLQKRLKKKRWKKKKIDENVEAELIGLISWEARQKHRKVFDVDAGKNATNAVLKIIKGRGNKYKKEINWL